MVNKVAVMALVAILAVPILLGYGLNLEETTSTEYVKDNDSLNVTSLLKNGTANTHVHGDIYQLNTNFTLVNPGSHTAYINPVYETSNNASSLKITNTHPDPLPNYLLFADYNYFFNEFDSDTNLAYVDIFTSGPDDFRLTIYKVHTLYYDYNENILYYTYYSGNILSSGTVSNSLTQITYYLHGNLSDINVNFWLNKIDDSDNQYVNFSAGYHFTGPTDSWYILLPETTEKALLTVNLDSITDPNYSFRIRVSYHTFDLVKTTVSDNVTWTVTMDDDPSTLKTLYYDNGRSDNTYQILAQNIKTTISSDGIYQNCKDIVEFRYIGGWTTLIGEANVYKVFIFESTASWLVDNYLGYVDYINISGVTWRSITYSPQMRMDDAYFTAYNYPAIVNKTYVPSSFKTNPSTLIKDISLFGSSIYFGGNEYVLSSDGNITVGIHKVSVNGIVLDSVPTTGGYDNRINGITISTTAQPSNIVFGGSWLCNVSTDSQTATSYTKTEWIPGEFAWDGIDTNFLMVGLLTCFGVFIALGIYLRKTKSSLWPLLIVCGCAAGLFFCMI